MPPKEITLSLVGKKHEYGDVWTFVFKSEEPVNFLAGQYAHVRVPTAPMKDTVRELSFASAPSDSEVWFSVHVRPESLYKQALAELKPGDAISIFKIKGDFTYPPEEKREAVFIAGGVGMTPFRSIIRSGRVPVELIHVASDGYLYEEELKTLSIEQRRITRAELDATLAERVAKNPGALYYVAGSPLFTVTVATKLEQLGIAQEQIKRDDFDGYSGDA